MTLFTGSILALDLSLTRTGWALGVPGEIPKSGSLRFAKDGFSHAAHFAGCRDWLNDFVAVNKPRIVIFEGPLAPSYVEGNTTTNVVRTLMGLIAVVECTLYGREFDVREAAVSTVRQFFLGTNRIRSADAKIATKRRCVELGWQPANHDAADALALWAFMVSIVAPAEGLKFLPLFGRKVAAS